jgi:signal transduction histidine kinase
MQATGPLATTLELDAAILQAAITCGLAVLSGFLYRRYRKSYFAWFAVAWALYVLRLGAIMGFLLTRNWSWLYWHQVITGWTALALLWAALVFSRQVRWRWGYALVALFPLLWAYIAIYQLDNFLLAAGPAVLFMSLATLWTGWVFFRHWRLVGSVGAGILAGAFILWSLHHLDYPFLRARGAWAPWGYYLDIAFLLAVGAGIVILVLDDLERGLRALTDLSGDLQRRGGDVMAALLARPLTLPAVSGTAFYRRDVGQFVRGAGRSSDWTGRTPEGHIAQAVTEAMSTGRPQVAVTPWSGARRRPADAAPAYAAVLPILAGSSVSGALILVGDARDPFTALDDDFLEALGRQVGAALENADLDERLRSRSVELARLSARMVEQHEDERRRLSRELHDETAQVFSAVKMELAVLRSQVVPAVAARLDRLMTLIDKGIRGIRSVVNDLRPSLLDDLGLLPALRSLVADFSERSGIRIALEAPAQLPPLSKDAELALFRALQEALSNVVRHAGAQSVGVEICIREGALSLTIADDGRGPATTDPAVLEREGHMGLTGMRERIAALGGTVRFDGQPGAGARVEVRVPVTTEAA